MRIITEEFSYIDKFILHRHNLIKRWDMEDTGWLAVNDETIQIAAFYEKLWEAGQCELPELGKLTSRMLWLASFDLTTGLIISDQDWNAAVTVLIYPE